ncbi:MAG: type II toxin-antitoxin system RelE/ParE family toxin [Candidatus Marinimicrobia bacterium]|nr:type II toxin-antitoxin system RelE/ParE family toxin [Candidatus Neomarinimicrobiota bacterium]
MIRSFRDRDTQRVFERVALKRFGPHVQRIAQRKLMMLDAAQMLDDLRIPPGNRLEKLKGDRSGRYSIRINDQWRICFIWKNNQVYEAEIVDYH